MMQKREGSHLIFLLGLLLAPALTSAAIVPPATTVNHTEIARVVCAFNDRCRNATAAAVLRDLARNASNTTTGLLIARVVSIGTSSSKQQLSANSSSNASLPAFSSLSLNLTCTYASTVTMLYDATKHNVTRDELKIEVGNANCTNLGENLNTTDIENLRKTEAKPFLKVLYIATQLFIYMLTASCFGVFAQLRKRKANVEISALPRADTRWTRKGWTEVAHNNSMALKKVVEESCRENGLDSIMRDRFRSDTTQGEKLERIGFSAQGVSFRQQVACSHVQLQRMLGALVPRRPGGSLRQYLLAAVERLEQDEQEYAVGSLPDARRSDLHKHVDSYLRQWERATFGDAEFDAEEWSAFRSLFNGLCDRVSLAVERAIERHQLQTTP
jgi:hypothetical protein